MLVNFTILKRAVRGPEVVIKGLKDFCVNTEKDW